MSYFGAHGHDEWKILRSHWLPRMKGYCGGAAEECSSAEMATPGAGHCRNSRLMKNVGGGSFSSARPVDFFSICNDAKSLGAFVFLC